MHNSITGISKYLKYEGVNITPVEVMKMIDVYLRITLTVVNGVCDNTKALNLLYDPEKKISFAEMGAEGIDSIKNYICNVSSGAEAPFSDEGLAECLKGGNTVTIFKAIHLFLDILIGFADKYVDSISSSTISPFEFRSYDEDDDSAIKMYAYRDTEGHIVYQFVSDCLLRSIDPTPVKMV